MHLIQRMKIWKELRDLETRAREEPSPSTFVDLGQVYINLEMHDKAQRVAEDGLALFPKSTELRQLVDCAHRGAGRQRIAELRAKLTRSPSPKTFRELAQLLVDLGDSAGLQSICQEWSVRFPGDAGAWLVIGQMRLVNFYRDLAAREGAEAVRCLEQAVRMDANDAKARKLLGEVLYRIGAVRKSQEHLTTLQEFDPNDAEVAALLQHVSGLADSGGDVAALLADVESQGCLLHPPLAAALPRGPQEDSIALVREGLAQVATIPGVRKATFIQGSRALVKGAIRDGRDPFLRVVRVVAKAAHRFTRRLDIGSANKTVLEGDFGRICICVYGEALAGAQCDANADLDRVLAELQEIVAGALHLVGGNEA
ncbi:MAG: tetratricopeptide repeat protein [Planctomycetes bacterium]|nr:tetratricopeptide repeat protein [Planctomycetota bacterium]